MGLWAGASPSAAGSAGPDAPLALSLSSPLPLHMPALPTTPLPLEDDESARGAPVAALQALAQEDEAARARALEQLALSHAMSDQAAESCFYLCRSLGLARQQELGSEPGLELLFQLLGALADLPAEIQALPLPEGQADGLGMAELCHQLEAARTLSAQAWADAADQQPQLAICPSAPAQALH